jgi:NTP pyrophosphatase (non-canonical NTP hydrolase)
MREYSICGGKFQVLCELISEWRSDKGFDTHWKNVPTKLMLIVTELSEAMEAYRHLDERTLNFCEHHGGGPGLPSQELAENQYEILMNFREELADALIRLMDLTGSLGIDLEAEMVAKMAVNEGRPHKHNKQL